MFKYAAALASHYTIYCGGRTPPNYLATHSARVRRETAICKRCKAVRSREMIYVKSNDLLRRGARFPSHQRHHQSRREVQRAVHAQQGLRL